MAKTILIKSSPVIAKKCISIKNNQLVLLSTTKTNIDTSNFTSNPIQPPLEIPLLDPELNTFQYSNAELQAFNNIKISIPIQERSQKESYYSNAVAASVYVYEEGEMQPFQYIATQPECNVDVENASALPTEELFNENLEELDSFNNIIISIPVEDKTKIKQSFATWANGYTIDYALSNVSCQTMNIFASNKPILQSIETNVLNRSQIEVGVIGEGQGSGGVKYIEIISNKDNFIDIKINLENITSVKGLPQGLLYENNHIKGTPVNSGAFVVDVVTSSEIFKVKFVIPTFERIY